MQNLALKRLATAAGVFLLFLFLLLSWNQRTGLLYLSGGKWFDSCWAKSEAGQKGKAASLRESQIWDRCNTMADDVFFDAGMLHQRNGTSPTSENHPDGFTSPLLEEACLDNWADLPMGGIYLKVIEIVQEDGGVGPIERILPAEYLIRNAYESRWPACSAAREKAGIPKVVKVNGKYDYAE